MATGDIKNNLRKLMVELKQIRYPLTEVDLKGLAQGTPRCFLPILHYIFLDYSVDLTEFFAKDYELYGKTDLRFVETVYKVLRDVFHYKPPLTREKFLSIGYAERKIIELCDILKRCREKSAELNPKTSKTERKHVQSKGKNKIFEVGKEIESQTSNGSEKRGFPQNDIFKKKGNSNDILKKTAEQNKENTSIYPDVNKPMASARDNQTSRQSSSVKSVRWKEDDSSTISWNKMKPSTPSTALIEMNNGNAKASVAPAFSSVMSTSMRVPPKTIPMPVTMTTVPKPSPELMLTPIGKTRHQPIPLSGSRHDHGDVANISLIDLTDSTNIQQPRVVRHEYNEERETEALGRMPDQMSLQKSQDNELKLLKSTVQELQEKLDSALSQNNEMSARVVLLESRVKLLEEATTRIQCGNCMDTPNYTLPNYNVSTNPFYTHVPASSDPRESRTNSIATAYPQMMDRQEYISHPTASSSRSLMNEFTDSQSNSVFQDGNLRSQRYPGQSSHMVEVPQASMVTEISDDDDYGTSTVNTSSISPKGSPLSRTPNKSTGTSLEAISPFPTTQEIHLKFSDPSTTATIMNVERRLQETREMLANAARFAVTSLP